MDARTSEETRNEQAIRTLYSLAEAKSKDTPKFVSMFTNDGYFYDVAAGKKYYGQDIGVTVDIYATAFPDMHRELYDLHTIGDLVLVELSLNGTHKGDLVLPPGTEWKGLKLKAELEVKGITYPVKWACQQSTNPDGSLTLRHNVRG